MAEKVRRKQQNSKMCLVCGLGNSFGLKASFFELENDELVAVFRPQDEHQGYPGRLHGGMASAILDEAIGRAIMLTFGDDVWWVTVDLSVKFRKPIPLDQELRVFGRITKPGTRFFEGTGEIVLDDGRVAATGTGRYMKVSLDQVNGWDPVENDWEVSPDPDDPEWIELTGEPRQGGVL